MEGPRMPSHSIGSGNISFGLVSIPVKMFTAASSEAVSFNQIHPKCGGRIKQQLLCPTCDEVRDFSEVDKGDEAKIKPGEMDLANRLIAELSKDTFRPDQYADEYRTRVLAAVEQKVEGQEITSLAPQAQRTQVIDLMEALKQSLGSRGSSKAAAASGRGEKLEKKPAAKAREKAEAQRGPIGPITFGFRDLLLLRTTKGLLESGVPLARIRRIWSSLREQLAADVPLTSVTIRTDGEDVIATDGVTAWRPDSGQSLL